MKLGEYDLTKIDALFTARKNYVDGHLALTNTWWSSPYTNYTETIRKQVLTCAEHICDYSALQSAFSSYFHVDVWDIADKWTNSYSDALKSAAEDVIFAEWHQPNGDISNGNPDIKGLVVYFGRIYCGTDSAENFDYYDSFYIQGTVNSFLLDSHWDELLKSYYEIPHYPWITDGHSNSYTIGGNQSQLYQFNVTSDGDLIITADPDTNCDLKIQLFRYNGASTLNYALYSADAFGKDGIERISATGLTAGWYIIEVYSWGGTYGSGGNYTLTLNSETAVIE